MNVVYSIAESVKRMAEESRGSYVTISVKKLKRAIGHRIPQYYMWRVLKTIADLYGGTVERSKRGHKYRFRREALAALRVEELMEAVSRRPARKTRMLVKMPEDLAEALTRLASRRTKKMNKSALVEEALAKYGDECRLHMRPFSASRPYKRVNLSLSPAAASMLSGMTLYEANALIICAVRKLLEEGI